jgi:hypothetical protein
MISNDLYGDNGDILILQIACSTIAQYTGKPPIAARFAATDRGRVDKG